MKYIDDIKRKWDNKTPEQRSALFILCYWGVLSCASMVVFTAVTSAIPLIRIGFVTIISLLFFFRAAKKCNEVESK
jgi:hypothetical protein